MPAQEPQPKPLSEELAAFIQQGRVSIVAATCNASLLGSVFMASGCRVSPDRRRVTIVANALQAAACLADVRATGRVAVTFSLPSTNRSVQFKGFDAVIEPVRAFDLACTARHTEEFIAELMPLREFGEDMLRAMLHYEPSDLVAVSFTPADLFVQTPGPGAGARL